MTTLAELFGNNPKSCGHEMDNGGGIYFIEPSEFEDWAWAKDHFNLEADVTAVRVCWRCYELSPSIVARHAARVEQGKISAAKADAERAERWADGADMLCPDCEQLFQPDQLIELRECPHCEEFFNGTDEGRNCPSCNRPFSRKIADGSCPDCLDESAEPVKVEAMPE